MWWPYIKCPIALTFTAVTLPSLLFWNLNYNSPWVETLQNKTFLNRANLNFIFIVLIDFKSAALYILHEKSFGCHHGENILLQARDHFIYILYTAQIQVQSHTELVRSVLALEGTKHASEPVTQMAVELISNHFISVE